MNIQVTTCLQIRPGQKARDWATAWVVIAQRHHIPCLGVGNEYQTWDWWLADLEPYLDDSLTKPEYLRADVRRRMDPKQEVCNRESPHYNVRVDAVWDAWGEDPTPEQAFAYASEWAALQQETGAWDAETVQAFSDDYKPVQVALSLY